MRRILLFAYGTLLDHAVQRRVFGRPVNSAGARLAGWAVRARMVRGRYPGIERAAGAAAPGRVLELGRGDLGRADAYEDAPRLYRRRRMRVRRAHRTLAAWVYVPTVRSRAGLRSRRGRA